MWRLPRRFWSAPVSLSLRLSETLADIVSGSVTRSERLSLYPLPHTSEPSATLIRSTWTFSKSARLTSLPLITLRTPSSRPAPAVRGSAACS